MYVITPRLRMHIYLEPWYQPACPGADGNYTMVWHFFLKLVKASESQPARQKVRGIIIPW